MEWLAGALAGRPAHQAGKLASWQAGQCTSLVSNNRARMGPSAPEMLARSSADLAPNAVGGPPETVFRRALMAPTWQTGHQAPLGDSQTPGGQSNWPLE